MKIKTLLLLEFSFLMIVAGFAVYQIHKLSDLTINLHEHPYFVSNNMRDIRINVVRMQNQLQEILLMGNTPYLKTLIQNIDSDESVVYRRLESVEQRFLGDKQQVVEVKQTFSMWKPIRDQIIHLVQTDKREEAIHLDKTQNYVHLVQLEDKITPVRLYSTEKAIFFLNAASAQQNQLMIWASVVIAIIILTSFWIVQATQALHESEARFRAIFNNVTMGIGIMNPKQEYIQINPKWTELFGYTVNDLKTFTHKDLTTHDNAHFPIFPLTWEGGLFPSIYEINPFSSTHGTSLFPLVYGGSKGGGKNYAVEKICLRKDGTSFYAHVEEVPNYQNGVLQTVISIVIDITERKRAEHALRRSETRLAEAQRVAHLGNWEWDLITGEQQWSEEIYYILGITYGEIVITHEILERAIYPNDLEQVMQAFEQAILYGKPYNLDFRVYRSDRTVRYVQASGELIRSTEGDLWRFISTIQDITERKQVEEALRLSEERFELAMQGASDGLWDWNPNTNKIYYSPRWKQMLGYADYEIGDTIDEWKKLIHPDDYDYAITYAYDYMERKVPIYEFVHRLRHKQGHYIWILTRGIGIWNAEGQPVRLVGTHVDITAQKQVETELMQAKQAAEIANRAKTSFLAHMSHELRTPLNAILGFTQILRRDKELNKSQKESINIIHRSSEYLLTLISDILDLSKIEAGRVELQVADFNFQNFLQSITELFQIRAKQKGLLFTYEAITRLPIAVQADERRLRQIIINLLSNAIKFTDKGGFSLKVGYHQDKIRFQVEDTGVGIAANDLVRIFSSFEQVGRHNHQEQGTGLGLAITKRLVEIMGGTINVQSTLGVGSTFWVEMYLPEVEDIITPIIAQELSIIGYQFPIINGQSHKIRILIAEDKIENRAVLINLLKPLDFEICEAENGEQAVLKAQTWLPDIVLLDLIMPVMSGFTAARQLRSLPEMQHVKIIALSASAFQQHKQESLQAGCNDFITKPFRADVLLYYLQKHLQLTWVYESYYTDSATTAQQQTVISQSLQLPKQQATAIYNLALRGDVDGIIILARRIGEENGTLLKPLTHKLEQLAGEFEIRKICELVKPYMQENKGD